MNQDEEIRELQSTVRNVALLIAASLVGFTVLLLGVPVFENEIPSWVIHVVTVAVFFAGFGCGWWYRGWARHDDRGVR